jgi:hypothetical protein
LGGHRFFDMHQVPVDIFLRRAYGVGNVQGAQGFLDEQVDNLLADGSHMRWTVKAA